MTDRLKTVYQYSLDPLRAKNIFIRKAEDGPYLVSAIKLLSKVIYRGFLNSFLVLYAS